MESGFFKVQPRNANKYRQELKCGFIWIDNPDEDKLILMEFTLGNKFYDGCDLLPADKNDIDFQQYIENDLIKAQKDIEKLLLLKQRLLEAKGN